MPGALDRRMRATAERLIRRYGKTATLRSGAPGTYSPSTGDVSVPTSDAPVTVSPPGPVSNFRAVARLPASADENTLIDASDLECWLAAKGLSAAPQQGRDQLVLDGEAYSLVAVQPLYSGEQVAAYLLVLRK